MSISLAIYTGPRLDDGILTGLKYSHTTVFDISITTWAQKIIPNQCIQQSRGQVDVECLLDFAIAQASDTVYILFITTEDCFTSGLNFVFGLGREGRGCVVSTYRLGGDR